MYLGNTKLHYDIILKEFILGCSPSLLYPNSEEINPQWGVGFTSSSTFQVYNVLANCKKDKKDHVCTVPVPHGHGIKLDSLKPRLAPKFMIILWNLITTNHRKSVGSKHMTTKCSVSMS